MGWFTFKIDSLLRISFVNWVGKIDDSVWVLVFQL